MNGLLQTHIVIKIFMRVFKILISFYFKNIREHNRQYIKVMVSVCLYVCTRIYNGFP